jgi:hypothetical protein
MEPTVLLLHSFLIQTDVMTVPSANKDNVLLSPKKRRRLRQKEKYRQERVIA